MCKQEDYFQKKMDLHAQPKNIYFHVMQAQGDPGDAELLENC